MIRYEYGNPESSNVLVQMVGEHEVAGLSDDFFQKPSAIDEIEEMFRTMAPFNRFLNEIFDDYE